MTSLHKRVLICLSLLHLVGVSPWTWAQEEQWLQYRYNREASEIVSGISSHALNFDNSPPSDLTVPVGLGHGVIYVQWKTPMAKDDFVWVALGRSRAGGMINRLVLDENGNGQLADDPVVKAYRAESQQSYFGPVKVLFRGDDGPIAYHVNFVNYDVADYQHVFISSAGWYEGKVEIAGQEWTCTLVDHNTNGQFNDQSVNFSHADRISLARSGHPDLRIMGRFIEVNGQLVDIEVARDGAFVVAEPAENVEVGRLQLPRGITHFSAAGPQGHFQRSEHLQDIRLPIGHYRIDSWAIERKDAQGTRWKARGRSFDDRGLFEIRADQPASLEIGEPLISTLEVTQEDQTYRFNQSMIGNLGEDVTVYKNDGRAPAPRLLIRNKAGSYNDTRSFEYG